MRNLFLRAAHWRIFLFFVPAIAFVVVGSNHILLVLALLSTVSYGMWLWITGSFLNAITERDLRLRFAFFRLALASLFVYFLVALTVFQRRLTLPATFLDLLAVLFVPLHFIAIFCMLYVLYFVSKSLVLAETGGPAHFSDYAGPLILVWFFPLGVWAIQPRINRLYLASASQAQLGAVLKSRA